MQSIFFEIGFIVVLATILGALSRRFKQPLFLAYIVTGLLVNLFTNPIVPSTQTLSLLSELGIAFLLFIVGLELNPNEIKEMGKPALIIGAGQVGVTTILGVILGLLLGLPFTAALYLALALGFSSTIIVVKLLSEKGEMGALYGRIGVGVLLFQDLVAVIVLILLTGIGTGSFRFFPFLLTIIKAIAFLFLTWLGSKRFLSGLFKRISNDTELLFIGSIAWCLLLAGVAWAVGFSLEIGAFLAGLTLATTPFRFQIGAKIKPLRDFFILIFFVVLGLEANFLPFGKILLPAIICTVFVLIVKPLVLSLLVSFVGYRKRSAFLTGLYLSQVSEFSLILAALGVSLGQITQSNASLITLTAILTIGVSSYAISQDSKLYKFLRHPLSFLETKGRGGVSHHEDELDLADHVILIGCHRMGIEFWQTLKEHNIPFVVLDFDPKVISMLREKNVPSIFGDMGDPEILELLHIERAKMIISTVSNFTDNLELLEMVQKVNPKLKSVLTAQQVSEGIKLYQAGASYVILPHLLGGHVVTDLLNKHWENDEGLSKTRERHIKELFERREFGRENG